MPQVVGDNQFKLLVDRLCAAYSTARASYGDTTKSATDEVDATMSGLHGQELVEIGRVTDAGPSSAEAAQERMTREAGAICEEARRLLQRAGEEYGRPSSDTEENPATPGAAFADVVLGIEDLRFRLIGLGNAAVQAGDTGKALALAESILSGESVQPAFAALVGHLLAGVAAADLTEPDAIRLQSLVSTHSSIATAAQDKLRERRLAVSIANCQWKKAAEVLADARKAGREDLLRSPAWIGSLVFEGDRDDQDVEGLLALLDTWRNAAPGNPQLILATRQCHEAIVAGLAAHGDWDRALASRRRAVKAIGGSSYLDAIFNDCPLPLWGDRRSTRQFEQAVRAPVGLSGISPSGALVAHVSAAPSSVLDVYEVATGKLIGSLDLPSDWQYLKVDFPSERNLLVYDRYARWGVELEEFGDDGKWRHYAASAAGRDDPAEHGSTRVITTPGKARVETNTYSGGSTYWKTVTEFDCPNADPRSRAISAGLGAVCILDGSGRLSVWAPTGPFMDQGS